jgi:hypothetical protein
MQLGPFARATDHHQAFRHRRNIVRRRTDGDAWNH